MPGRSRPGPEPGGRRGRGGVPSRATASAEPPYLGLVRSRRAASAASALSRCSQCPGRGPFRPPREPALTARRQRQRARPGPAEQRRRDPRPRLPQQRLPPSPPQRRPPASRAGPGSHGCSDWFLPARPGRCVGSSDWWFSLAAARGRRHSARRRVRRALRGGRGLTSRPEGVPASLRVRAPREAREPRPAGSARYPSDGASVLAGPERGWGRGPSGKDGRAPEKGAPPGSVASRTTSPAAAGGTSLSGGSSEPTAVTQRCVPHGLGERPSTPPQGRVPMPEGRSDAGMREKGGALGGTAESARNRVPPTGWPRRACRSGGGAAACEGLL
ncbi:translation initiation factor IF-2-like [Lutra lutra]|uniref:translation initiation factor IF-2-like n=1 Tax=Lutra lutra TaxID=9657 RepID=UPI001FD57B3F|nr:translation initiation factor IF-2-like [Lutra lutra]